MRLHLHFGFLTLSLHFPYSDCTCMQQYFSTLANSSLIILFFRNVEIFKNYFFQIKKYCEKENSAYLGIFPFVEINISNLTNYSMDMCWNGHGTRVSKLGQHFGFETFWLAISFNFPHLIIPNSLPPTRALLEHFFDWLISQQLFWSIRALPKAEA
jgi:hypothetical protein